MKTYSPKASELSAARYLVDADGQTLGRLASNIAKVLKGKHKPTYTPHLNTGDFVVVVNAERVHVTGNKREAKTYERYSGYPGGLRSRTFEEQLARRPEEPLREAVRGMLQHNTLGGEMLKRLGRSTRCPPAARRRSAKTRSGPTQKGEIEVIGS